MEIMTRKLAQQRGDTTYFTGALCINGHTTFRYTLNGACSACVKAANQRKTTVEGNMPASFYTELSYRMVQFKSRVFDEDLDYFRSIVFNTARLREPSIRMRDLWGRGAGTNRDGGAAVHVFSGFPQDVEDLKKTAIQIFINRCNQSLPDINAERRRIEANIARESEMIDDSNWPTGDPR